MSTALKTKPFSTLAAALAAALIGGFFSPSSVAQRSAPSAAPPAGNSSLDAPLFYQLLIGEMRLASGEPGTAYEVIMDAARRTRDDQLFRRAAEIALQARQGEQALITARAWRASKPTSTEAARLEVQVLLAQDRAAEASDPIRALIRLTPADERARLVEALPATMARRGSLTKAHAETLDRLLSPFANDRELATAVKVASGQAWLAAGDADRALKLATEAQGADPTGASAALLAMELMAKRPDAEALVTAHLRQSTAEPRTRLAYVRTLMGAQRHADALRELEPITAAQPTTSGPFLTQGALQLELRQFVAAESSLQKFLALLEAEKVAASAAAVQARGATTPTPDTAPSSAAKSNTKPEDDDDDDDEPIANPNEERLSRAQDAYLLLARSAEQRGDAASAESWLARIDDPRRLIEVQTRRATLLAQKGQIKEAREAVRRAPERSAEDARAKLVAEAAVLRDVKRWGDAYSVLQEASQRFPDDSDLVYEQSMVAEKLNRLDEAESLLKRVIVLKPDNPHAYNALGYSLADRGKRLPEARSLIAKALELAPGDPFITDSLGWVEFRLGNHAEALRLLQRAWAARPDAEIGAHLGEVLWVMGRQDEARQARRAALALDAKNDSVLSTLARLKVKL